MLSVMIGGVMACSHRPGELAAGGIVLGNRKVDAGQQLKRQTERCRWSARSAEAISLPAPPPPLSLDQKPTGGVHCVCARSHQSMSAQEIEEVRIELVLEDLRDRVRCAFINIQRGLRQNLHGRKG